MMGFEYFIKFKDNLSVESKKDEFVSKIDEMPSVVKKKNGKEFWLKTLDSKNLWEHDVRIFLEPKYILIEVSCFNDSFYKDIKLFVDYLQSHYGVIFVDDDDEPFNFE